MTAPLRYRELEDEIERVRTEKDIAIEAQEFEKAVPLRDKERKLTQKKKELEEELALGGVRGAARRPARDRRHRLDVDGHPRLRADGGRVAAAGPDGGGAAQAHWQHQAIVAVSKSIRARAGIKDPKRRPACSIFLGPSGVGKTELARTLAEFLFGDEDAMIQVDMSEYMEKHLRPGSSAPRPATSAMTRAASD